MSVQKGDIVLVPFPFTDLSATKVRPALVLWVNTTGDDVTLCFISSQNINNLSSEEFLLEPSNSDFAITGLKIASKVRVTRVATIEKRLIARRIGNLTTSYIQTLNKFMCQAFQL